MSEATRPIPIRRMLEHIARELEMSSTVFSVAPGFRAAGRGDRSPELPLGVAAGPHTATAQGLISAYAAGARFFELRPVSLERDLEEYTKARFVTQLLGRELGLGEGAGTRFALTLPADREALAGEEWTAFLTAAADLSATPLWQECLSAAREALGLFNNLDKSDLSGARLRSRLAPCAVVEWDSLEALEEAALYLMEVHRLDIYLPLDATALGAIGLRGSLAAQGGEDCPLDVSAFGPSLDELAPVVERLRRRGEELGASVGLRLGGTLPLEGGRILEGAAMAPATLLLAARCAARWPEMPVLWAGHADYFNVGELVALGFACVNVRDTLSAPGGYGRLRQLAKAAGEAGIAGVDARGAEDLSRAWSRRKRYRLGQAKPQRERIPEKVPLIDCFAAPCQTGCPFGMDIAGALRLMSDGRYRDALGVILDKNPMPHLTGAICPQPCQKSCTRLFYDQPIRVREAEAVCAQRAWNDLLARLAPPEPMVGYRVAVVGGGMAGMAAAYLLGRRGVPVTLFESAAILCPTLRPDDPELRTLAERDGQLLEAVRVDVRLSTPAPEAETLLTSGYSHVVLAPEPERTALGQLRMPGAEGPALLESGGEDPRVFILFPRSDAQGGLAQVIADAHALADGLLGGERPPCPHPSGRRGGAMGKKGRLCAPGGGEEECRRCLECATVCEACVDACPNRAFVPIAVPTRSQPQILRLDALCRRCGACGTFCPYDSEPYREKFTLFETAGDFEAGEAPGFVALDFLSRKVRLRLEGAVRDVSLRGEDRSVPGPIQELMETVFMDYPYLLDPDRRKETDQVRMW